MTSLKPEPTIAAKLPNVLSTKEIMCHMDSIPDDDMYDEYADNFYDVKWVRQDTILDCKRIQKFKCDKCERESMFPQENKYHFCGGKKCDGKSIKIIYVEIPQKVFDEVLR